MSASRDSGVAAAQLESNTVWSLITSNPVMTLDGKAIFTRAQQPAQRRGSSIDPRWVVPLR